MPLTPEEEQELQALEPSFAKGTPIPLTNAYGQKVGIPQFSEQEAVEQARGAASSLPVNIGGGALKWVGSKGRGLVDYLSGKMAGLSPKAAQTLQSSPRTVQALANAPELRQQVIANKAIEGASRGLGNRAAELSSGLQAELSSKLIPEAAIAQAGEFAPKGIADLVTGKLPASEVYKAAQAAGREANFANNPLVVGAQRARAEDAGKAFGVLRGAVGEAAPNAEPIINALEQGVNASKTLSKAQSKPLAFMTSRSPDIEASRQGIEALLKGDRLSRTASQLSAAKELAQPAEGYVQGMLKPIGVAGLRATQAVTPIAGKTAEVVGGLNNKAIIQGIQPNNTGNPLTPEEEQELQLLEKEQLSGRQ